MKYTSLIAIVLFLPFSKILLAQPPNGEPGKCYAMCIIPDEWTTRTEKIIAKEASTQIEIIPAVFDTIYETVLDKAPSMIVKVIPAEFETITERIMVKAPSTRIKVIPAVYETVTDSVLTRAGCPNFKIIPLVYETIVDFIEVQPAITRWKKSKFKGCGGIHENECEIWCLVEQPPQYECITRNVLKTPATIKAIEVPEEYQLITKKVVKVSAEVDVYEIPAEYKTISKRVVKTPARIITTEIPATYKTIQKIIIKTPVQVNIIEVPAEHQEILKRILVRRGGFSEWREILCPTDCGGPLVIHNLQKALKKTGYYKGKIDGVLGKQFRKALIQFQKDNNLPIGRLDIETVTELRKILRNSDY